jgi:anthranilate synthase/aminodeoxychorismate synthase-like glutamine amidotransferase
MKKVLILDNFDSFTFNLVHYLQIAGAQVQVELNTHAIFDKKLEGYHGLVLSPGPNEPLQSGKLMQSISLNIGHVPILGVCLGMQALALHYGGTVSHAPMPVHGKQSMIEHGGNELFTDVPSSFGVGRYHSLMVGNLPSSLQITASFQEIPMAMCHKDVQVQAVQFHPESILTPHGQTIINNWVSQL